MRTSSQWRLSTIIYAALLASCAGGGGDIREGTDGRASRAQACLAGDRVVSSEAACLTDDAACYALANGDWCTGPREASCPAGSSPLPAGLGCPAGARCFSVSESLECAVGT